MKTQIYNYRSGQQIIPDNTRNSVIKSIEEINYTIARYDIRSFNRDLIDRLHAFGWSDTFPLSVYSKISINSIYEKIGLCVQTGNVARTYADILKLQTLYTDEKINAGIIVLPVKECADTFGKNVANYERLLRELSVDLKANSPEQVRFAREMREAGVFYQTKRGETPPSAYKAPALNTDLMEVGKLCLAAIYQIPCASRARPSTIYSDRYYEPVFDGNQPQVAKICKELLYIDNYFRSIYQKKFDSENNNKPGSANRISFAHNSRTICIAFVALAAKYNQKELSKDDIETVFNAANSDNASDAIYEVFHDLGNMKSLLPPEMWENKNKYDAALDTLFSAIIEAGIINYTMACSYDSTLTATNYLKKERNYYGILRNHWNSLLIRAIEDTFG